MSDEATINALVAQHVLGWNLLDDGTRTAPNACRGHDVAYRVLCHMAGLGYPVAWNTSDPREVALWALKMLRVEVSQHEVSA